MSFSRLFIIIASLLFGTIFFAGTIKKWQKSRNQTVVTSLDPMIVEVEKEQKQKQSLKKEQIAEAVPLVKKTGKENKIPKVDRVRELFNKGNPKFPFVETIVYTSRPKWLKGRPAWLSDYAAHFETSRHFIARSLNGRPDYFKQDVREGDRFNVFRQDKQIEFHLIIDISRCKMWLYCIDKEGPKHYLIKTYDVALGRLDPLSSSGSLTPLGIYELGSRVAVYKPKIFDYYLGKKTEMIRVFGTRWIPFEKEIEGTTLPAKGFGIHGVPWIEDQKTKKLVPDESSIGSYQSDGCIRLRTDDMEELFAIITTKPTKVELVKDFYQSVILKD